MSSDLQLERLLRDVRELLPEPAPEMSRRARQGALAAIRRRRPRRLKAALLIGAVLVVAVGSGGLAGALIAPSGTAAGGPVGLGFLPEAGWYALQAPAPSTPGQSLVAMAANVPFAADDGARGVAEASALPYSTLQGLPANGIVIVASFTALDLQTPGLTHYLSRLPLRLEDASRYVDYGVELRPEQPLGQYQLRAVARGWSVDVTLYFGTSEPSAVLLAEAQRQLDGLVVREKARSGDDTVDEKLATGERTLTPVIDRTFSCALPYGKVRVVASPRGAPDISGGRLTSSGYVRVTWGSDAYALGDLVVAARPGFRWGATRFPAAVYASAWRCSVSSVSVPLTRAGLPGRPSAVLDEAECTMDGKALVRVRALVESPGPWRRLGGSVGSAYDGVRGQVVEAQLAVREERTGKPLTFATLGRDGSTKQWSAPWPRCF